MLDYLELKSLSDNEKSLLMNSVNCYKEKIEFILKNSKYYLISSSIISDFEEDLERIDVLQKKLFSILID